MAVEFRKLGEEMKNILDLKWSPVGVRLMAAEKDVPNAEVLTKHRYCQAVMKARKGYNVLLKKDELSCPAAASSCGFRELADNLKSGKALVGFGIVSDEAVGQRMFAGMPKLQPGLIKQIHLFPLDRFDYNPDVVIVEDEVEKLMWIVLAYLNMKGGERVQASTAVLQAACVDATIIPYLENRLNYSFGCYGCRDATDIGMNEAILGFPGRFLPSIIEILKYLSKKAIPMSRSKQAYQHLLSYQMVANEGHAVKSPNSGRIKNLFKTILRATSIFKVKIERKNVLFQVGYPSKSKLRLNDMTIVFYELFTYVGD